MSLPERNIEELWSIYNNLLKHVKDDNIQSLIDSQGQRILECTYSQKISDPFCGIGGLVEYSIKLAKTAKTLVQTLNYNITAGSIIKCSLLSEIGRIGSIEQDRLKISDSDWHKEKLGQYYNWNEDCDKYSINHMTLFYMNLHNIKFTWGEYQSLILLNPGSSKDLDFYGNYKSDLSTVLCMSKEVVLRKEKNILNGTYTIPF